MNNKRNVIWIFLAISLFIFVGCKVAQKPVPNPSGASQDQLGILSNRLPNMGGQQLSLKETRSNSEIERAEKISRQLSVLPNVSKAPVIINGNTAIIGLELANKSEQHLNNLKNELSNNNNKAYLNSFKVPGTLKDNKLVKPNNHNAQNTSFTNLIVNKVRIIDPTITSVLVTTDNNMVDRLQSLKNSIIREIEDISKNIQK